MKKKLNGQKLAGVAKQDQPTRLSCDAAGQDASARLVVSHQGGKGGQGARRMAEIQLHVAQAVAMAEADSRDLAAHGAGHSNGMI